MNNIHFYCMMHFFDSNILKYLVLFFDQLIISNINYDKDVIFPLQRGVGFEGKNFCIPNDYDKVLSQMYGDYMTLPKPEDRCWHARKIEV